MSRMAALAAEAHLTLALMHAQGVVFHLSDREHRSPMYAAVHGAAAAFSAVSFFRHLAEGRRSVERDGLDAHYARLEATDD